MALERNRSTEPVCEIAISARFDAILPDRSNGLWMALDSA
jgi:hypothetical protein